MKAPSVTSPKKQIPSSNTFSRRSALKTIGMASAAFVLPAAVQAKLKKLPKSIKLGIITDTHIGFVKDAPERLDVFLDSMKAVKPDVLVQMGDFANPNEKHQPIVDKFNASISSCCSFTA